MPRKKVAEDTEEERPPSLRDTLISARQGLFIIKDVRAVLEYWTERLGAAAIGRLSEKGQGPIGTYQRRGWDTAKPETLIEILEGLLRNLDAEDFPDDPESLKGKRGRKPASE